PNNDLPLTPGTAPILPLVCRPCSTDGDCGPASFCATEDSSGLQFCTAPCNDDATCDGLDQSCFTVDDQGHTGCYPTEGSCEMYLASGDGSGTGSGAGSGPGT